MSQKPEQDRLRQEMTRHLVNSQLPCTAAHTIAFFLGLSPQEVGEEADQAGIRISQCQLGLFGYGPKSEGLSKLMRPATRVPADLEQALAARARNGQIVCTDCWQLAAEMGTERLAIAEAAEALGLRVVACQLGCF